MWPEAVGWYMQQEWSSRAHRRKPLCLVVVPPPPSGTIPPIHAPAHSCTHPPTCPEIALKRVRSDCRAEVARAEARMVEQEATSDSRIKQLESMVLLMATAPKEMYNTPFGGSNSTTMALLLHAIEGDHSTATETLLAMAQVHAGYARAPLLYSYSTPTSRLCLVHTLTS